MTWHRRDEELEKLQLRKITHNRDYDKWMWLFDRNGSSEMDIWEFNGGVRNYLATSNSKKPFENEFERYLLDGLIRALESMQLDEIKTLGHLLYFKNLRTSLFNIYEKKDRL